MPWLLALAVATCTQDNLGPSHGGTGYFSFRPVYPMAGGASLSQFGIVADSVHILLTRPVDEIVIDTTVPFPADSTQLRLALPVELASSPEVLTALIEISAGGVVIFRDSLDVTVKDGAPGNTPPPTVTFDYVGPGSNIATLSILPGDTTLTLGDTLFFTASAVDSSDAAVPDFYVGWKTSDTTIAKINGAGRLIAPLLRGSVQVIGLTPTGIADTTTVTFAPVPVIITADSGDAQVGIVGDSLGALFVARVKGADSLGISGVPVRFAAVTAGGAVRDTVTLLTDATGRVRTRALLGTLGGSYSYTATALGTGLPARTFTATAGASAAAAIAIQSGNGQVDTIGKTLAQPFVVRVTDAFTNPVAGAVVVFSRTSGSGTLADDSVTTDAAGLASVGYTLGGTAGTDSVHALLAGTSAFVDFSATAISAAPTQIIQGLGSGQTAVAGAPFTDSLTVQVLDAGDNAVAGVWVHWLVVTGNGVQSADSTLTDVAGHAGITLTAGTIAGTIQVDASVNGIATPTSFVETIVAAAPASMVIASGNGQTGVAGAVLPLSPEVRIADAFNNPIAGLTVDFAVTAGAGTIDSTVATTDSTGRANAGLWTLGVAGLNQVTAVSAAVPADTLLFDATATPAGTSKLWTGASTTSWTDANSWSPVGAPGITDNVFIPAAAPSPVLGSATTIAGLTIEAGATLTSNALFTVSGDADIGGTLTGTGTLALSGSGGTLRGTLQSPIVNLTGNRSLSGTTSLSGALNVTSGTLTVNGQALTVGGAMTVSGSGQLAMGGGTDSVDVGGNFIISSGITGTGSLSTGVMVLRGNFTQTVGSTTNFAPSGTHSVRFLGSGVQTVTFASPGSAQSRFQDVEFGSASGTTLGSTFTAMGIVTANAGTVTGIGRTANIGTGLVTSYATWQVSTTLWGADPTVYPDSLPRNVTAFNAWTLTKPFKADSNLVINTTGVLDLNGHALRIGGTVTQGGVLRMQNTADTL
ncbi:MAG TPA: Ig-like domain-containing protein, partial [Gemmatimonadales bacterium]|nr:Ig-like domain-containing protein [Gemmatimonadales bacterium]